MEEEFTVVMIYTKDEFVSAQSKFLDRIEKTEFFDKKTKQVLIDTVKANKNLHKVVEIRVAHRVTEKANMARAILECRGEGRNEVKEKKGEQIVAMLFPAHEEFNWVDPDILFVSLFKDKDNPKVSLTPLHRMIMTFSAINGIGKLVDEKFGSDSDLDLIGDTNSSNLVDKIEGMLKKLGNEGIKGKKKEPLITLLDSPPPLPKKETPKETPPQILEQKEEPKKNSSDPDKPSYI